MSSENESPPTKLKSMLTIAYDGTKYGGWQVQPNATSIQSLVQTAVSTALRKKTDVTGSGRTDSGVHALGQVAHFTHDEEIDLDKLRYSFNGLLPLDIRILSLEKVPSDFHARYSALGKVYRYHLDIGKVLNPFKRLYSYHVPYPIDLDLLCQAAKYFIGEKDFTSFSNEAHRKSAAHSAIRHMKRIDITTEDNEVIVEFEANGFLYRMARNIMGMLLDIARGKMPLDALPEIFAAKDRKKAGTCAPPHGLFLVRVLYPIFKYFD